MSENRSNGRESDDRPFECGIIIVGAAASVILSNLLQCRTGEPRYGTLALVSFGAFVVVVIVYSAFQIALGGPRRAPEMPGCMDSTPEPARRLAPVLFWILFSLVLVSKLLVWSAITRTKTWLEEGALLVTLLAFTALAHVSVRRNQLRGGSALGQTPVKEPVASPPAPDGEQHT